MQSKQESEPVILSVYFNGTNHKIDDVRIIKQRDVELRCESLAMNLMAATIGTDLSNKHAAQAKERDDDSPQQFKMGFNGCLFERGFIAGGLFGAGLDKQSLEVVDKVLQLVRKGKAVRLNAYGHSRGAIACLMLAKMLGKFDPNLIQINLVLHDPVPGNLSTTPLVDFRGITLTRQTMDLSECQNIGQVLVLYPHKPFNYFNGHDPLVPKFPVNAAVTEEIIPGGHSAAQFLKERKLKNGEVDKSVRRVGVNPESDISLYLVTSFLRNVGTTLNAVDELLGEAYKKYLFQYYEEAYNIFEENHSTKVNLKHNEPLYVRSCHGLSFDAIITYWPAQYFSSLHKTLAEELKMGLLQDRQSIEKEVACSFANRRFHTRPRVSQSIDALEKTTQLEALKSFVSDVTESGLSKQSKAGEKGRQMRACCAKIQELDVDAAPQLIQLALQNFIALCLQRDRNVLSLYSTTQSGHKAMRLLNSGDYDSLASLIPRYSREKTVRYRDLRQFVLGKNDGYFFNAKHARSMYALFQDRRMADKENLSEEQSLFLSDQNAFYRSK